MQYLSHLGMLSASLVIATALPVEASGFREQQSYQFSTPGEQTARLNREVQRLNLNAIGVNALGGVPAAVSLGQSASGGGGSGLMSGGSTIGNVVNGTTSYTINLNGDGNEVAIDGYLNLSTDQVSEGQQTEVQNSLEGDLNSSLEVR